MKRTDFLIYRAAQLLRVVHYAAVATVDAQGRPWNAPLVVERDADLRFYWYSDQQSQHAQNVRHNGQAFLVFYRSNLPEQDSVCGGVYVEAVARELHEPSDVRRACRARKPNPDYPKAFMGNAPRRVYEAVPQRIWINDVQIENGVFIRDYRVELSVPAVRAALKQPAA